MAMVGPTEMCTISCYIYQEFDDYPLQAIIINNLFIIDIDTKTRYRRLTGWHEQHDSVH